MSGHFTTCPRCERLIVDESAMNRGHRRGHYRQHVTRWHPELDVRETSVLTDEIMLRERSL